jgi:hypothetical protein
MMSSQFISLDGRPEFGITDLTDHLCLIHELAVSIDQATRDDIHDAPPFLGWGF